MKTGLTAEVEKRILQKWEKARNAENKKSSNERCSRDS
jgi:hypothetical protein